MFLKVWRDLKFKVKKKLVANKAEFTSTGGGIYKQMILSPKGSVQGVEFIECEDMEIEVVESNELVLQNELQVLYRAPKIAPL